MNELKPCPFCGSTDVHITAAWPHYVYCRNCGARVPPGNLIRGSSKIEDSVDAWNRRAQVSAVDTVEVVRCDDCKYYKDHGICELLSYYADPYHTGHDVHVDYDNFCSYGERRDDG